jgi:hypothetical protein
MDLEEAQEMIREAAEMIRCALEGTQYENHADAYLLGHLEDMASDNPTDRNCSIVYYTEMIGKGGELADEIMSEMQFQSVNGDFWFTIEDIETELGCTEEEVNAVIEANEHRIDHRITGDGEYEFQLVTRYNR